MKHFREIKQLLKEFCVNFVQVKWGQILIKSYFFWSKLWRKFWGNLEGILQRFDEIFRKVWRRLQAIKKKLYKFKTCRNSGEKWENLARFNRNTSVISHLLSINFFDTNASGRCGIPITSCYIMKASWLFSNSIDIKIIFLFYNSPHEYFLT